MKNSPFYTIREVPTVHPGCSLADSGASDYDDFDNPLKSLEIISESKRDTVLLRNVETYISEGEEYKNENYELSPKIQSPSQAMNEQFTMMVVVPEGVHPFTYIKEIGVDFNKDWIFLHKEVLETLRNLPTRHYLPTKAYGEIFRFEDLDMVSLQEVNYLDDWKVIMEGEIGGVEFYRPETPKCVIEVVMH